MLQIKHLTITHKKDLTPLVQDLSFVLAPGDRAALIGEEGNGKSTVLKLLFDPALVEPYAEWTGDLGGIASLRRGYLAQELTPEELDLPVAQFCRDQLSARLNPGDLARLCARMGLSPALFPTGGPCPPFRAGSGSSSAWPF